MPDEEAARLITATAGQVLTVIKSLSDKQGVNKRAISIDTIALAVRTSIKELTPVIEHLKGQGHIAVHHNPSQNHNQVNNPYSITLL